jgi:hypothetical protein
MKVLLAIVGAFLVLDALVVVLMLLGWAARGRTPDFLHVSLYGVLSITMVVLKTVGVAGAILLWRLRPTGRLIAGVVLGYNVVFTAYVSMHTGVLDARVWGTIALNAALLLVVALPAAAAACQPPLVVPRARPSLPTRAPVRR